MTAAAQDVRHASRPRPRIIVFGLLAASVASGLANALISALGRGAGAENDFGPIQAGPFMFMSVLGIAAGAVGWTIVRRTARNANRLLTWLVPLVATVSTIPDIAMLWSDYEPHANTAGVTALITMHLAVTAIAVTTYRRVLPVANRQPAAFEATSSVRAE